MTEQELAEEFRRRIPIYRSWGEFVTKAIVDALAKEFRSREFVEHHFLVAPAIPRVKAVASLIEKAFYRGKSYEDPLGEITDKVGVRFIVLFQSEIPRIEQIIESSSAWNHRKDKDFSAERRAKPDWFAYQSNHYIVFSKGGLTLDDKTIPHDTPCEVQIRTLLQHCHSELSHRTTYKKKQFADDPEIKRLLARTSALNEIADDILEDVHDTVQSKNQGMSQLRARLDELYSEFFVPETESKLSDGIENELLELTQNVDVTKIRQFLIEKNLQEPIGERKEKFLLYRQPIVLLLYFLIMTNRFTLRSLDSVPAGELKKMFNDLGFSMPE